MRRGDWKLRAMKGNMELFNLAEDPSETTNLANEKPEMVKTLSGAFDTWIARMAGPITGGSKLWEAEASKEELTDREKTRLKIRMQRKREREAEKKATKQKASTTEAIE